MLHRRARMARRGSVDVLTGREINIQVGVVFAGKKRLGEVVLPGRVCGVD